jgi:hypothetical protein
MQIIEPVSITDAMLVSSSLPETDYAAWNAGTAYAVGDRAIRATTHSVYLRLVAGTTATAPELDTANWQRVGPTNRWAMFDQATGTASSGATSITFTIAPGLVRALALLDVDASSVDVVVTDGATTVYSRTVSLSAGDGVTDWYDYFFAPIVLRRTLVLTDLPPYATGQITITLHGGGTVNVGTVVAGTLYELGGTRYGMSLGVVDYSKKDTDEFGVTTLVERPFAKRMTVPLAINPGAVDEVARRLQTLRARNVVWIGVKKYDQSVVYGFIKDWSIDVPYDQICFGSITIEGLT